MAYYGVSNVIVAEYDAATDKYKNGFILEAVGTSVTPAYSEGTMYLDNKLGIQRKAFKQADVTGEVGTIPLAAAAMMYGHTVDESKKSMVCKTDDKPPYCGYGFVGCEAIDDDTDTYTACWIHKVKFAEGEDGFTTRGENITFNSQKFSGTAVGAKDKAWKTVQQFDTEAEALAWLKEKACITEAAA